MIFRTKIFAEKENFAKIMFNGKKIVTKKIAAHKKGEGKVKVSLRQRKHNLDLKYNLMGFETIEINLVYKKKSNRFF